MKQIISIIFLIIIMSAKSTHGAPVNVVLDGHFDDWSDKPASELKYPWNNEGQVHILKWHMDDNNLYLYIKMGTRGGQALNYYQIVYYVDQGSRRQLALAPDTPSKGRISIVDTSGGYLILTADGYVVRGDNKDGKTSDQGEFRIPLSTFRQDTNNQMFTLRLEFPNLGSQSVIFEAGSTRPYMGLVISGVVAIVGAMIYKRKRRPSV
ncbi:Firmicu-CTERM sorting domain-containing protein [Cellulosilyticum sp. I15G10I2]|uniref:Firmicu-CTERM sorting domain-containing protein n=1 Tax=Cellulosilyticum sp. I15G10I2 TaxID=1892843 RepID=UPI00085C87E8|nr:Firmicu-CTERM sorting domain-containing protein [Cellulosilyticum sp. I15G10I2]